VMGADDDVAGGLFRARDVAYDVDSLAFGTRGTLAALERERRLERCPEGLESNRFESLDDERSRLGAARRAHQPPFHVISRQCLQVGKQSIAVDRRGLSL